MAASDNERRDALDQSKVTEFFFYRVPRSIRQNLLLGPTARLSSFHLVAQYLVLPSFAFHESRDSKVTEF